MEINKQNLDFLLYKVVREAEAIAPATEEELQQAADVKHLTNYNIDTISYKELRGTPADPEEGVEVVVYSEKHKKHRHQILKRKKLINQRVMLTNSRNHRTFGKCIAFDLRDGRPVIVLKDNIPPHEEPNLVYILEV